jgi:hypothetical protein
LCRVHLRNNRKPGEDVERARRKIIQAAPYAVDVLEDLMENAESEPVRLKASTEILDRAGIRGGQDLNVEIEITEARPASMVVAERLARLAEGALSMTARLHAIAEQAENSDIVDGEVVDEEEPGPAAQTTVNFTEVVAPGTPSDEPIEKFEDLDEESMQ